MTKKKLMEEFFSKASKAEQVLARIGKERKEDISVYRELVELSVTSRLFLHTIIMSES